MKIISEVLNKEFDSVKECLAAEKEYAAQQEAETKEQEKQAAEISKKKKELSDAIEAADKDVDLAYDGYAAAKKDADEIIKEAYKKANEVVEAARIKVTEAEKARYNALAEFNKEFGTYKMLYTGKKAEQEYYKAINNITSMFGNMFRLF